MVSLQAILVPMQIITTASQRNCNHPPTPTSREDSQCIPRHQARHLGSDPTRRRGDEAVSRRKNHDCSGVFNGNRLLSSFPSHIFFFFSYSAPHALHATAALFFFQLSYGPYEGTSESLGNLCRFLSCSIRNRMTKACVHIALGIGISQINLQQGKLG